MFFGGPLTQQFWAIAKVDPGKMGRFYPMLMWGCISRPTMPHLGDWIFIYPVSWGNWGILMWACERLQRWHRSAQHRHGCCQRTGKSVRKTASIHLLGSLWRVLIKTQRFNHFCFWPAHLFQPKSPLNQTLGVCRVPRLWSRGWRATAQDRGWPDCGTAGWWICRDLWCAMAAMGFGLSFDSIMLRNLACTFHWGRGALTKLVSWLDLKESLNCLEVNCPVRVCMAWKVVSLKVTPYTLE